MKTFKCHQPEKPVSNLMVDIDISANHLVSCLLLLGSDASELTSIDILLFIRWVCPFQGLRNFYAAFLYIRWTIYVKLYSHSFWHCVIGSAHIHSCDWFNLAFPCHSVSSLWALSIKIFETSKTHWRGWWSHKFSYVIELEKSQPTWNYSHFIPFVYRLLTSCWYKKKEQVNITKSFKLSIFILNNTLFQFMCF